MGAHVDRPRAAEVDVSALPGDHLRATGQLTDAIGTTIREHKSATLAELAAVAANDSAPAATAEEVVELHQLVVILAADWPADEQAWALAVALTAPEAALEGFRARWAEARRYWALSPFPHGLMSRGSFIATPGYCHRTTGRSSDSSTL